MTIRFTVLLLGTLSLLAQGESAVVYRGRYINRDYGFQVSIPSGYVGLGAAASAPKHGFVIKTPDGSEVSVDASYDTIVGPSGESFEEQMMKSDGAPTATLGGVKAWKTIKLSTEGERHIVRKEVVAHYVSQEGDAIIYTVSEETHERGREASDRLFDGIVESFRLIPIDSSATRRPKERDRM